MPVIVAGKQRHSLYSNRVYPCLIRPLWSSLKKQQVRHKNKAKKRPAAINLQAESNSLGSNWESGAIMHEQYDGVMTRIKKMQRCTTTYIYLARTWHNVRTKYVQHHRS
ncbi:hypothetical protein ACO0LO_04915 [Undibacterium sp. TJN25]|uniref:hypothetical protein n=1 Tax=Undibacterium sp. TJN25 TaxID=3413056 RepID=UPI003BF24364